MSVNRIFDWDHGTVQRATVGVRHLRYVRRYHAHSIALRNSKSSGKLMKDLINIFQVRK